MERNPLATVDNTVTVWHLVNLIHLHLPGHFQRHVATLGLNTNLLYSLWGLVSVYAQQAVPISAFLGVVFQRES